MSKRRALPWRRSLCLGGSETPLEKFLLCLGVAPLRLGEPLRLGVALLRLGQATVLALFFLRLILEPVTLLLDCQWKIIRHKIRYPNK